MFLVMSTVQTHKPHHPSSDQFKNNPAFSSHLPHALFGVPVCYSSSQGCTLLCTDLQTRERMLGAYGHPIIQFTHPIFGYICSNALFHLSSLHFPIQTFPFSSHHTLFLNLYLRQSRGDYQNRLQPKSKNDFMMMCQKGFTILF